MDTKGVYVTFGVYGEFDEYFTVALSRKEFQIVQMFIQAFNYSIENVNIKIIKVENQ